MPTFILLWSIFLPPVAMPAPILKEPGQVALQEEMSILVYGVMQLREALRNLYWSTAQKLDKIRHRAGTYEEGLRALRLQAQGARQSHEEIRGTEERLKAEDVQLRQGARGAERGLQSLLVDHRHLVQRVKALQEMLDLVEQEGFQDKGRVWAL